MEDQLQKPSHLSDEEPDDINATTPILETHNTQNQWQIMEESISDISSTSEIIQLKITESNKGNSTHVSQTQFRNYIAEAKLMSQEPKTANNRVCSNDAANNFWTHDFIPLNPTGLNLQNIELNFASPVLQPKTIDIHNQPQQTLLMTDTGAQVESLDTTPPNNTNTQTDFQTNMLATLQQLMAAQAQIMTAQQQTQQQIEAAQQQTQQQIEAAQDQTKQQIQNLATLQAASQTQMDNIQKAMEIMSIECGERAKIAEIAIKQNKDDIITLEQRTQIIETNLETHNNQLTNIQLSLQELMTLTQECQQPTPRTYPNPTTNNSTTNTLRRTMTRDNLNNTSEDESSDSTNSHRQPRVKRRKMSNLRVREPSFSLDNSKTAPEFIIEMNDFYAATDVTDDGEKVKNFPNYLKGNAAKWSRIQVTETTSWHDLCEKFISQYFNHNEIAQEWENLNYKQYTNDCEGFIIKAWNLQTTLHPNYTTGKKLANILRKLPMFLQNKVKERENNSFNDFLKNVKEIEKSSSTRPKDTYYNNQRQNSPPQSPRNRNYNNSNQRPNSPPQSPRNKNYNNYNPQQTSNPQNHPPNKGHNRWYQNSNTTNNNSYRPQSRKRQFNNDRYRNNRPPYTLDKRRKDNYDKPTAMVGSIRLIPIENQPGAYTLSSVEESPPLIPILDTRPRSPKRDQEDRMNNSPNTWK